MLDEKQIFEGLSGIDDELITRSEIREKSIGQKCIVFATKLAAACVTVMLLSTNIYEARKNELKGNMLDQNQQAQDDQLQNNQSQKDPSQNGEAEVIPSDRINVGAFNPEGRYYKAAELIGCIDYEGNEYRIVAGAEVLAEEVGKLIDTYQVDNKKVDAEAEEKIAISLYKKNGYYEGNGMVLAVEGIDGYFFIYNVGNLR